MNKKIVKYAVLTLCGIVLFFIAHDHATAWRGYHAIGGEGFFIFLPVLWCIFERMAKDIKAMFLENRKK